MRFLSTSGVRFFVSSVIFFFVPSVSRIPVSVHGLVAATETQLHGGFTRSSNPVDKHNNDCKPEKATHDGVLRHNGGTIGRRRWISTAFVATTSTAAATSLPSLARAAAEEAAAAPPRSMTDVEEALSRARSTLQSLLDNWSNAVIDCTYADVPRDLLETKNKELLLEKAKTSALFDKSASVIGCKTVNTKVRDYIGATGKGPVSVLPRVLKAGIPQMMDQEDGDLDLYVQTTERVQQALSRADSLSYEARRDFSSMNNFDESKQDGVLQDPNSNLFQAKEAIATARDGLDVLLKLLRKA